MSLRPARWNERDALEDLQRRASLELPAYRAQLLADPGAIGLPAEQFSSARIIVAERDGALVGFHVVLPRADGDAELDGLFVEPAAWRGGIGRQLVLAAAASALQSGATWLHVVANPSAEPFYLACGFAICGEQHTRFGSARTMRLLLRGGPPANARG